MGEVQFQQETELGIIDILTNQINGFKWETLQLKSLSRSV